MVKRSPVVFPEGIGVCPWRGLGGADIARATSEKMETYQAAIWAKHYPAILKKRTDKNFSCFQAGLL